VLLCSRRFTQIHPVESPKGRPAKREFNRVNADMFKHKEITDIILKSFYEAYNELVDGFLESAYENALYIVLIGYGLCVERFIYDNKRKKIGGNLGKSVAK